MSPNPAGRSKASACRTTDLLPDGDPGQVERRVWNHLHEGGMSTAFVNCRSEPSVPGLPATVSVAGPLFAPPAGNEALEGIGTTGTDPGTLTAGLRPAGFYCPSQVSTLPAPLSNVSLSRSPALDRSLPFHSVDEPGQLLHLRTHSVAYLVPNIQVKPQTWLLRTKE
jgi:hypothetical protein